jgi:hypothetical protein
MASVDFTNKLRIASAVPEPYSFSGWRAPGLGGAISYEGRFGDRWMMRFRTPLMHIEPDWRRLSALFDDAERLGGIVEIPQPDLNIGAPGTPLVSATTASGRNIPIDGLTPHYAIRAGQWINYVKGGVIYADRVAEQVIANGSGQATVRLRNLLRASLADGDSIELGNPRIEGAVEVTSRPPLEVERVTAIEFTVTEFK